MDGGYPPQLSALLRWSLPYAGSGDPCLQQPVERNKNRSDHPWAYAGDSISRLASAWHSSQAYGNERKSSGGADSISYALPWGMCLHYRCHHGRETRDRAKSTLPIDLGMEHRLAWRGGDRSGTFVSGWIGAARFGSLPLVSFVDWPALDALGSPGLRCDSIAATGAVQASIKHAILNIIFLDAASVFAVFRHHVGERLLPDDSALDVARKAFSFYIAVATLLAGLFSDLQRLHFAFPGS